MTQAKSGDNVTIHYTGKLADGTIFDSSEGREPLPFIIGKGQVIEGFEEAVIGMKLGEAKTVTIPSEKAYGPRNEQMIINVPIDQVPPDITPEVGMQLELMNEANQPVIVRITQITEEHVSLDANPPLAGKDLTFDIELVTISG
ncbi:peptidylprolyl isomerase [Desulfogranum marinum]|uniref:FKBP-type peptidyl-prolyl cis-trans isomerase n=1 Tax=Desulfogranum marinum TaxID=453220 RepID=UPI001964E1F1|nr:peptidylprolyl isomerase [Desulfogranum marinum]MBM9513301.1 peptidylprolyl isomerase [Desulfogranum marinum]